MIIPSNSLRCHIKCCCMLARRNSPFLHFTEQLFRTAFESWSWWRGWVDVHTQNILFNSFVYRLIILMFIVDDWGLKTWFLTPLAKPTTPQEVRYNLKHACVHWVVERTIGLLKSCWMCLDAAGGMLLYRPEKESDCFSMLCTAQYHNDTGCTYSLWTTRPAWTCGWQDAE